MKRHYDYGNSFFIFISIYLFFSFCTSCIPIPPIYSSPYICPLPLQPLHNKKRKERKIKRKTKTKPDQQNKRKQNKKEENKAMDMNLIMEAIMWLHPLIFPASFASIHC